MKWPAVLCVSAGWRQCGRAGWSRVLALSLLTGCAVGRIRPDGEVYGAAIGRAKIERCIAAVDGKPSCTRIQGGALSSGLVEMLEQAASAVAGWWAAP